MSIVNNVTRLLDSRKILYTTYELSTEKRGAQETASLLNVDPASIFKTIVVLRDKPKKPLLVLVSGDSVVDLKLLASSLGEKKVYLPTEKEAEQITGLQAGGISPLALLNKGFQVVIDSSAQNFEQIHISGGQRGLNIKLPVADLVALTKAQVESVSKPESAME
ncbi:MAG: Cys-tRNA(Pro) deacylase [Anaerolineales bacterium]|nr:Cys-tRNA(Pro) deacylase [Anaerolineales bacterium]